ncbi:plastocyanin/azurin family copper-binding protein [Pontibacterium granulatum]|uniref:cupredoxin domain-containing protein n=1 Tax=Pontibacterium granulatum TaxID=2036029 RepID=UPI002499C990|nr:plastocyanin/azurin family copper-binding protein [Pontibacterium granulatum]MDI3325818.1 plastocyanin/azurin family copper-binding protein [Pontibacterium granulatum]
MSNLFNLIIAAAIYGSPLFAGITDHGPIRDHENGHTHMEKGHLLTAAGYPGRISDVNQKIHVSLGPNMSFSPAEFKFNQGDTIRFYIFNHDKLKHEFVIGDKAEMREHAALMRSMPETKHDEGNAVTLKPGEIRQMTWTFSKKGIFEAACHLPGHYEEGMKAVVEVI